MINIKNYSQWHQWHNLNFYINLIVLFCVWSNRYYDIWICFFRLPSSTSSTPRLRGRELSPSDISATQSPCHTPSKLAHISEEMRTYSSTPGGGDQDPIRFEISPSESVTSSQCSEHEDTSDGRSLSPCARKMLIDLIKGNVSNFY